MPELHPDCLAYLDDLRALNLPASTSAEIRHRYRALCARFAGPLAPVPVQEISAPIIARLYGLGDRLLAWFHGGRMVSGGLDTHDAPCRLLAFRSGWRVLAVDYRLAPEHPFPAALEDAAAALRFAASLSPTLAAGGDSAGAHLALTAASEAAPPLHALVLIYPMIDATRSLPSHTEFEHGPGTSSRDIAAGYQWWLPLGTNPGDPRVSPLFYPNFAALPRSFVLTAGFDPLRDEGLQLVQRLEAGRVPVTHVHFPQHLHGFLTFPARFAAAETAVRHVAQFLSPGSSPTS
jgi:acetyl esterase